MALGMLHWSPPRLAHSLFCHVTFLQMSKKKMKKMLMELTEANRNHSVKSKERKVLMQEQGRQIEELSRQVSRLTLAAKHHDVALAQLKEAEGLRREEDLKASEDMHRKVTTGALPRPHVSCVPGRPVAVHSPVVV